MTEIVRQGVWEGLFTIAIPSKAGEVILSLLQGMDNTYARLLLSLEQEGDEELLIKEIVATHAAYVEAIERVLGARPTSFSRMMPQR